MRFVDHIHDCGFKDPFNTCINVHTNNFDFNLAFAEFEDEEFLGILVTDESGREKLKILNKKYVEYVEIVYQDDLEFGDGEKTDNRMFN